MERRILHNAVRFDNENEKSWQYWDWTNEVNRLVDEIDDLEATGLYPHNPQSYMLWTLLSDYGVLPYAGGYMEQPAWFDKDITYFTKVNSLIQLQVAIDHHLDTASTTKRRKGNEPDFE